MRRRFKCDPKWITVRFPAQCAEPNCQTEINSGERASNTPATGRFRALVVVTAIRPRAISTPTGSTKTVSNQTAKVSAFAVSRQRAEQSGS